MTATKPPSSKPAPSTGKPAALSIPKSKPNVHSGQSATRTPKTFSVTTLGGETDGEKILLYGKSGLGKTTLASMVPNAVFVPLDDGARKIINPLTGKRVSGIPEVETFDDLRDATRQAVSGLVPKGGALVIDTITRVLPLAEQWVVDNVPLEKGGRAKNIEHFGYGKGYRHVLDAIRNWLTDLDALIRSGRHVILLAQLDQAVVPNPAGLDYYEEVPKLIENKQGPIRTEVCEWVDHIARIGYLNIDVDKDDAKARAGKVSGESDRAVFTGGAQYFTAKSRPIDGHSLPPIIGFSGPADNSLWQFVFEGATVDDS